MSSDKKFLTKEANDLISEVEQKFQKFMESKLKAWKMGFDVEFEYCIHKSHQSGRSVRDGFLVTNRRIVSPPE